MPEAARTLATMPAEGPAVAGKRITYFVHDIGDAAVTKRVLMLGAAGAEVLVIGFNRGHGAPRRIAGAEVIDLGRTHDGKLLHRAAAVLREQLVPGRILEAAKGADILIGRNLEAFALACRAHRANPSATLVYECLDLHRLLLESNMAGSLLQRLEAALLAKADHIMVSSPAFIREYFARHDLTARLHLVENKVLALDPLEAASRPAPGPPWTIGWFGMLRCARSFAILADAAAEMEGRLRVLIAGRPTPFVFADLPALARNAPWVDYIGPYQPADLGALYGRCHFAWCLDYFEEELNSDWLLPNRLYESLRYGCVPIALSSVEAGRWLGARSAGAVLDSPGQLRPMLEALDARRYAELRDKARQVPQAAVIADAQDCRLLLEAIG